MRQPSALPLTLKSSVRVFLRRHCPSDSSSRLHTRAFRWPWTRRYSDLDISGQYPSKT